MTHRWIQRELSQPERLEALGKALLDLPEPLTRALLLRGVATLDEARAFFRPLEQALHDPFLMRDMDRAAARVAEAVARRERVLVYGDYDVDGTTATALMVSFLRAHGVETQFFIPDRIRDGYGLGKAGIEAAAAFGAALIIALDCGITAIAEAEDARARGLDLIICDHHNPGPALPRACAVLNPKRADCAYPFKELSGCGVGFKLAQAVQTLLPHAPFDLDALLDLAAVSIAGDIVPITGENRVLMALGLARLAGAPRPGFRALARLASLDLTACSTSRIVFTLRARINAAGRMGDAGRAARLMLAADEAEAAPLAEQLETANQRRRTLDQQTLTEAAEMAEAQLAEADRNAFVLYRPDWPLGVIGIVASRIVERFHKPALLLADAEDGLAKGSARSVEGVNIYEALKACAEHLKTFGGHNHAAGLALPVDRIGAFRDCLDAAVAEAAGEAAPPTLYVDAHLPLGRIDGRFQRVLKLFEPHGPHNDALVFQTNGVEVACEPRTLGKTQDHLKFAVRPPGGGEVIEAIGFGMNGLKAVVMQAWREGRPLDVVFSLEENVWNGQTKLQLRLRDLRLSEPPA